MAFETVLTLTSAIQSHSFSPSLYRYRLYNNDPKGQTATGTIYSTDGAGGYYGLETFSLPSPGSTKTLGSHVTVGTRGLQTSSATSGYVYLQRESLNTAPTQPGTFTSPLSGTVLKGGESISVSWDPSTDVDGNTITYYPEYLYYINGVAQSWNTLVNNSTSRSRTFTLSTDKTINRVGFRVRAYDGTVYSSYRTSAVFDINHNQAPAISIKNLINQEIVQGQIIKHIDESPFTFIVNVADANLSDTHLYSILLRNVVYSDWLSITRNQDISVTIPFADLLLGDNPVLVKVRDDKGAESTFGFTLRNIVPESLSQQHVYELMTALGAGAVGASSLQALKPNGYNKSTLSLAELINFLS